VTTAKSSNSEEKGLCIDGSPISSLSTERSLFPCLDLTIDEERYGNISRKKGNCT
jgi:hypothetical protein